MVKKKEHIEVPVEVPKKTIDVLEKKSEKNPAWGANQAARIAERKAREQNGN